MVEKYSILRLQPLVIRNMHPSGGETRNYCANNGDLLWRNGRDRHTKQQEETAYRGTDEEAGSCNHGWVCPWLTKFRRNSVLCYCKNVVRVSCLG